MDSIRKKIFVLITFGLCWTLIGSSLTLILIDHYQNKKILSKVEPYLNCEGLDLKNTALCLKAELSEFYNYNPNNLGVELSFEELIEQGGVCSHYSDWYNSRAEDLGFYTERVIIDVNEELAHAFSVISNDEGYCILDQLNIWCTEFAGDEDEE